MACHHLVFYFYKIQSNHCTGQSVPGAEQTNRMKLHYNSKTNFTKQSIHSVGHVDSSCVLSKQLVSSV